ncbi:MAG: pilus assembly protein PilP [Deltaproteobacteria bacterium]|nr:pilus assembly protein PilP [Deltaproteobacteria bacterium]
MSGGRTRRRVIVLTAALWLTGGPCAHAQQEPPVELAPEPDHGDYSYDAGGKRDPFRPLFLLRRSATEAVEPLTPLQRYEIGQLRLVGVIYDLAPPRGMVEDSSGLGFIVMPGTAIGPNGGVVTAIRPRQVVVEEWQTDVIGQRHKKEFVLELPSDQNERPRR